MRRILANLVLLMMLWGYVAPAALSATEADLPACCRGNGKHHCSMASMARGDDAVPAVRANSPQCPYRLLGSVLKCTGVAEAHGSFYLELPDTDRFFKGTPLGVFLIVSSAIPDAALLHSLSKVNSETKR